jgi:hypothetical protein
MFENKESYKSVEKIRIGINQSTDVIRLEEDSSQVELEAGSLNGCVGSCVVVRYPSGIVDLQMHHYDPGYQEMHLLSMRKMIDRLPEYVSISAVLSPGGRYQDNGMDVVAKDLKEISMLVDYLESKGARVQISPYLTRSSRRRLGKYLIVKASKESIRGFTPHDSIDL